MGKKSRNKKKSVPASGQNSAPPPRRRKRILVLRDRFLAVAGILLVSFIAWKWWSFESLEKDFMALAAQGEAAMSQVRDVPSRGRTHLSAGEDYTYNDPFPTSGPHDPWPINPGFYRQEQNPTQLVHSLEHGNIVIYYDEPASGVLSKLRRWTRHYNGPWSGIVLTPQAGLGEEIVLTAWTRVLRLDPFDPAAAAAFIDRYRGRGPENPVR